MSISSELLTLNNTKTAIRTAINNKGGSVTASTPFADYATAITNLPSGGGTPLMVSKDVSEFSGTTFTGIAYITSANIPSGVTTIGQNAFYFTNITNINIPNSVTTIQNGAFDNCALLTTVTLNNGLTTLGQNVFNNCFNLTSITIPSSVTSIGARCFYNCSRLTSIICLATTPPTLANANAFNSTNNCPIYVPSASVADYTAASGWSTYASRIVGIEDAVRLTPTNGDPAISVKNYELATAGYVQSTDVPSTIKNGAGSLEVCEGVTRIGQFSFQSGTSLTSVTLPSTLTRIDEAVFYGCSSLTSVTVNATTPPTMYGAVFGLTNNCPIYVPAASVDTYKAANGWSTYASRIQAIPSPSITITEYEEQSVVDNAVDMGEYFGYDGDEVVVDSFAAASANSTFDSDLKAANIIVVEDNNGNDITSQCTFTSPDFSKWDSTQDPSWDGESPATYEWQAGDTIASGDSQRAGSVSITATYGGLTDTLYLEYTVTDETPTPDPEEPEEPEE